MLRPTHPAALADAYRRAGLWRGETVWQAFAATAAAAGARTAVVDGATRTSWAALAAAAERVAGGLAALGVGAGDVVAVQLPNRVETLVALLAAARLGAVLNPVLPILRRRDLGFVLRASGARVLIVPGRYRDADHRALAAALRPELPALEHVVVVRDEPGPGARAWAELAAAAPPALPPPHDAAAIALLIYTSGTTAEPKGVLHSHDTLLAEARSLEAVHTLSADDVVLMPSPLTHVSGLVHALLVPAVLGTTAVLMERWEPGAALALIARERVTYMVGAPTFLRDLALHPALAAHDVRSLRLFSCGGADVDPALVREAAARLGCIAKRVYGSTEFPTITTTGPGDPPERRIETEGRPIGAAEIRLVDDDGHAVPAGAEGDILARGPECFLGYHDPAHNADAFTPDGWFRTEDLGVLDAAGYLRITGRRKDIIIRKGENVSAREIEALLAEHPATLEVAVVGVPDPACGEIACAVIRPRAGATAPTLAELADYLAGRGLSRRKLPERLALVEDFPRTASGKILKRALRARLAGGGAP
ncbi:MAG TPA: AMP-binding protein [Candidatus Binatia bacterium]|nr:AMP-binding protein [Candidatus Binatia bacterium]